MKDYTVEEQHNKFGNDDNYCIYGNESFPHIIIQHKPFFKAVRKIHNAPIILKCYYVLSELRRDKI